MNSYTTDYLILGAGISGMGAAYALKTKGVDFLILESNENAGGVLKSIDMDGYTLELGANTAAINSEYLAFLESLELYLEAPKAAAQRRFLWQESGLVEVKNSISSILKAPWLSRKAKWALITEPFRKKGTAGEESVYDFIARRLHPEIAEKLLDPVMTGIYGADIHQLSALAVLPALKEGEQKYGSLFRYLMKAKPRHRREIRGIVGGFSELAKAFERKYNQHLHLQTEVTTINKTFGTWQIHAGKEGRDFIYHCRHLILALPAYSAAKVLKSTFPELATKLTQINYRSMGTLSIGLQEPQCAHFPNSFGFLVPNYMDKKILGMLFNSSVFEGKAPEGYRLMTVFHQQSETEANTLYALLKEDLEAVGLTGIPRFLYANYWPKAIPFMELGYPELLNKIKELAHEQALVLCGNYLGKVSVGDSFLSGMDGGIFALAP